MPPARKRHCAESRCSTALGQTQDRAVCLYCGESFLKLVTHTTRSSCGDKSARRVTCEDCRLSVPIEKLQQHRNSTACSLAASSRCSTEGEQSRASGSRASGTAQGELLQGDSSSNSNHDVDRTDGYDDYDHFIDTGTESTEPNYSVSSESLKNFLAEGTMPASDALRSVGLSEESCRFFRDILQPLKLSERGADKIVKFFQCNDAKQIVPVRKIKKDLDRAIRLEGREPSKRIDMPEIVRQKLIDLRYPEDKVDRICGFYSEIEDNVVRLFKTQAAADGKIRMDGKEVFIDGERAVGHPCTANAWLAEEKHIREKHSTQDVKLAGLVLYSDKTTSRSISQLSYYPIYMTLANFEGDVFQSAETKVTVGFIPVVDAPDGLTSTQLKEDWPEAFNSIVMAVWKVVVDSLKRAVEKEPIMIPLAGGGSLKVCPRMLFFVGDYPELQLVCGCVSSPSAKRPCRVCMVKKLGCGDLSLWSIGGAGEEEGGEEMEEKSKKGEEGEEEEEQEEEEEEEEEDEQEEEEEEEEQEEEDGEKEEEAEEEDIHDPRLYNTSGERDREGEEDEVEDDEDEGEDLEEEEFQMDGLIEEEEEEEDEDDGTYEVQSCHDKLKVVEYCSKVRKYVRKGLDGDGRRMTKNKKQALLREAGITLTDPVFYELVFQGALKEGIHLRTPADWLHWILGGLCKSTHEGLCNLRAYIMGVDCTGVGAQKRRAALLNISEELNIRFSSLMRYTCSETGHIIRVFDVPNILTVTRLTSQDYGRLVRAWRAVIGSSSDDNIFPAPHYRRVLALLKALEEAMDESYFRDYWTDNIFNRLHALWAKVDRLMRKAFYIESDGTVVRMTEGPDRPKMHAFVHFKPWVMNLGAPLFHDVLSMETRHKDFKSFAQNDNGRGRVSERALAYDARVAFCTRALAATDKAREDVAAGTTAGTSRIAQLARQYNKHAEEVGFSLTPRPYKKTRTLVGIVSVDSIYMRLGKPTTPRRIKHTFAVFQRLLKWEFADDYDLWPPGQPSQDNTRHYDWRMQRGEDLPEPLPEDVLIHTSCESNMQKGSPRRYRADPEWHWAKRKVFQFVSIEGGLYAQLLFFFTASLRLDDGKEVTIERAFVRFLSPEGDDHEATRKANEDKSKNVARIKKTLLKDEFVLRYDGARGYGIVDIGNITTTLYVWPDFSWAKKQGELGNKEALRQWILWGWCHDVRGYVIASKRFQRHHHRNLR